MFLWPMFPSDSFSSLQGTWIRNSLLQALRTSTQSNTRLVSTNVVYENPSISALAAFASQFARLAGREERSHNTSRVEEMQLMVNRYSQAFRKHLPSVATPDKDVVLVTGTTGSLGTSLLAELAACDDVIRVFAINRKHSDGSSILDRQAAALERQGLDRAIASSPKVTLLEADIGVANLGLPLDIFELVCREHKLRARWYIYFICRSAHPSRISFTTVRICDHHSIMHKC